MNKDLTAYASSFAAFLVYKIPDKLLPQIKSIILFGSVARGQATKKSDVDIFIDTAKDNNKTVQIVSAIVQDFYKSEQYRFWKLMGIQNDIKPMVGRLDRWKQLKPSIVANGIVLYGKYTGRMEGKEWVIFYWGKVKPEYKRTALSKKIYGFSYKGKRYSGVLEETGGIKLSTNTVFVPLEGANLVSKVFSDLKIQAKTVYTTKSA